MEQYYNALNVLYGGDYGKIKKSWARLQNWEIAFKKEHSAIDPKKEWQKLEKLNIQLALQENPLYPELLKEIPTPPFGIYVLGNLQYRAPAIAIVGTRTASHQGKELAKTFAGKLGAAGLTIISGLALGIDAAAHEGALASNAKTIAVLGTPLNHLYPKQNERLAQDILKRGGAIISEYQLNQEYYPGNFLIRNRIISGLSNAILIIEAPEKSGALATAKFALEQNREIFVIPGNIGSKNYKGSNELIKSGATPVTEIEDILNYFKIPIKSMEEKQDDGLSESEKIIIQALENSQSTPEQILENTKINLLELNKNLAMLAIKGIIKESNGKYYLNI